MSSTLSWSAGDKALQDNVAPDSYWTQLLFGTLVRYCAAT